MNKGVFIISLDFELMTGVFDKRSIDSYAENIKGAQLAIPRILKLFEKYEIHATWATVGCLFYSKLEELLNDVPIKKPQYLDPNFSIYNHLQYITDYEFKNYYSGLGLLRDLMQVPFQEIATHTFSHYYCLEKGQTIEEFRDDIKKAVEKASKLSISIKSIVFPRNQFNIKYLKVCNEEGLTSYRGVESIFFQKSRNQKQLNFFHRLLRLIDSYINISGHNTYKLKLVEGLVNLPASFFLRPFSKRFSFLESFKIKRLKRAMLLAAKKGNVFHLWWHPHNFGLDTHKNLDNLEIILKYYNELNVKYGMTSLTMNETVNYAKK